MTSKVDDHRSDDEGDDEDVQDQKEEWFNPGHTARIENNLNKFQSNIYSLYFPM